MAADLAFGPDGRVYVANNNHPNSVLVFRPF
jgi:DNA-binding beta-propeller fold protein YncE